jgi:hypothetical protein
MHDPSFAGSVKCLLCLAGTYSTSAGNTIRIAVSFHRLGVDSAFGFCCRCDCLENRITIARKKQISVTVSRVQCFRIPKT